MTTTSYGGSMERARKQGGPPFQRRHEEFVGLARRLLRLNEEGRLPTKDAASHLGRFLMKKGTIRVTPVAKKLVAEQGESRNIGCDGCERMPECLTEHHEYWPRNDYRQPVEVAYRELPENKQILCEASHRRLHADRRIEPPTKPAYHEMAAAVVQSAAKLPALETAVRSMLYSQPDGISDAIQP